MVHLITSFPDQSVGGCTGELIAPGLVLTAGHCLSPPSDTCGPLRPTRIVMRFATRKKITMRNAFRHVTRAPGFTCHGAEGGGQDLAVERFPSRLLQVPSLPIASPEEIATFADQGVTAFGGGDYRMNSSGNWVAPYWVRKSRDGGLIATPFCQIPGRICIRYNGSTLQHGDSGGALVGWLNGWKLLAVLDDAYQYSDNNGLQFGSGISMGDPTAMAWVGQQIATATR